MLTYTGEQILNFHTWSFVQKYNTWLLTVKCYTESHFSFLPLHLSLSLKIECQGEGVKTFRLFTFLGYHPICIGTFSPPFGFKSGLGLSSFYGELGQPFRAHRECTGYNWGSVIVTILISNIKSKILQSLTTLKTSIISMNSASVIFSWKKK